MRRNEAAIAERVAHLGWQIPVTDVPKQRLSLSELAVNSVVSISGLAGIALGAWVLRARGVALRRIVQRSAVVFLLTSAANVGAVIVIGVPMWLGLLPGSSNPLLTLLPAAAALASVAAVLVAWLCYASVERRAEGTDRRPEKPRPVDAPTRS